MHHLPSPLPRSCVSRVAPSRRSHLVPFSLIILVSALLLIAVALGTGPARPAGAEGRPAEDLPRALVPPGSLSAGDRHTCALKPNGDAQCWGWNAYGQAPPSVTGPFTQIAADGEHTCALTPTGDAWCWGRNNYGQAPPAGVPGPFAQITAGGEHTCALTPTGDAWCWGRNYYGQAPPAGVPGPFAQITAGGLHTCALKPNGDAQCWGWNEYGQAPSSVTGPFTQISAGREHTCALKSNGDAQCWGKNWDGQAPPAGVPGPFIQLTTAVSNHNCALKPNGDAQCWGDNNYAQAPPSVTGPFTQIIAGDRHTCAVQAMPFFGAIQCWGDNGDGQAPSFVVGPFGHAQLSAGGHHTCALMPSGFPQCWGSNIFGQAPPPAGLGWPFAQITAGGTHTCALRPYLDAECWGQNASGQAPPIVAGPFTQLTAGSAHTCALKPSGAAQCWGDNTYGQAPPAGVPGPFTQLTAGYFHNCALTATGAAQCWGLNDHGQAPPFAAGPFTQIGAGTNHTCALTPAGAAQCWGDNGYGQAPPAGVPGPFIQITVGYYHTCALKPNGAAQCWGWNAYGQVPPAGVPGPFIQLAAGGFHNCALTPAGAAQCWGYNTEGQAPPLTLGPDSLPAAILGTPYTQTVSAAGGTAPYTFAMISGTLPVGLYLDASGLLTGTATAGGTSAFAICATDSYTFPFSGERAFTLFVDIPPEFTSTPITAATEDTVYTYFVTAADIDAGDVITISATTLPAWLMFGGGTGGLGAVMGTPSNADVGEHAVVLEVVDPAGATATQAFTVTVANVNDAPFFISTPITEVTEHQPYTYTVTAADIDAGDLITISATLLPSWLTLSGGGGGTALLTGTPGEPDTGPQSVALRVDDRAGSFATQAFTITVFNINEPPEVTVTGPGEADEGEPVTFAGSYIDPGSRPVYDVTLLWSFGDGITATGTLSPVHTYADNAAYTVALTVTDALGASGTATQTITIANVPPSVDAGLDQAVLANTLVTFSGVFTDPGTLDTHSILWDFGDGGTLTGTLAAAHVYTASGVYTVTLTVTDDDGGIGADTLRVTVRPHQMMLPLMLLNASGRASGGYQPTDEPFRQACPYPVPDGWIAGQSRAGCGRR